MLPDRIFAPGAISRTMESAVTVLPEPDSPTRPRVFPRANDREAPSTARTSRPAGPKPTDKPSIWRRSSVSTKRLGQGGDGRWTGIETEKSARWQFIHVLVS